MRKKMYKLFFMFLIFCAVSLTAQVTNVRISHVPITKFGYPGHNILFRADIVPENCSIAGAALFYRVKGCNEFSSVLFQTNSSLTNYKAVISNCSADMEYFISVTNNYHDYFFMPERTNSINFYSLSVSPVIEDRADKENSFTLILPDDIPEDQQFTGIFLPAFSLFENITLGIENKTESLSDLSVPSYLTPVAVYDFYAEDEDIKQNIVFNNRAVFSLKYFDKDDDGTADGTPYAEQDLKVYWYDSMKWHKMEFSSDYVHNVMSLDSAHSGIYGIFYVSSDEEEPETSVLDYVSHPSFFPLKGEIVTFGIKKTVEDYEIIILNSSGRIIRRLSSCAWDGRNSSGLFVNSGIYIYQIISGSRTISGLLNVIK